VEACWGHLDKGGTFEVKQEPVARGFWELTALHVEMRGKVLFFKTIGVQQNYSRSNFRRVPDNVTLAQAAQMLREQVRSEEPAIPAQSPSPKTSNPLRPLTTGGYVYLSKSRLKTPSAKNVQNVPLPARRVMRSCSHVRMVRAFEMFVRRGRK